MSTKKDIISGSDCKFVDPSFFRSIVRALQYLTITRLDLSFAMNSVCQHMHAPLESHFQAVKKILWYLKGTLHFGLHYTSGPFTLQAYSDADWAGDLSDRKSTTGYVIYYGHNPILWSVKKQPTVARSSTETE